MFTHLAYAFGIITSDFSIAPFDPADTASGHHGEMSIYDKFHHHVREQNPAIKTLLSIGGHRFNADPTTQGRFTSMVESKISRTRFIESLLKHARQFGFDGVDIDWEYPAWEETGGRPQDKANLVHFMRELRTAIDMESGAQARFVDFSVSS